MSTHNNYKFRIYSHMASLKKMRKQQAYAHVTMPKNANDMFKIYLEAEAMNGEFSSFDLWLLEEEFISLKGEPQFYFIDQVATAETIAKSSFQAKQIALQDSVTHISFPKGYKINNLQAVGVMVSVGSIEARAEWHGDFFSTNQVSCPKYNTSVETAGYVAINYADPLNANLHCRINVPFERLEAVLNASDYREAQEALNNTVIGTALTEDELIYQLEIARLAIKTMVYAQAMPDKVIAGVPDRKATPQGITPKASYITLPSSESGPQAPTSVGYFFRQLRNEKYYKGEHKHKPIGTRWIFVAPHKRGLHAETIID